MFSVTVRDLIILVLVGMVIWQEFRISRFIREVKTFESFKNHIKKIQEDDFRHLLKRIDRLWTIDQDRMTDHIENYHPISGSTSKDDAFFEALDKLEPNDGTIEEDI